MSEDKSRTTTDWQPVDTAPEGDVVLAMIEHQEQPSFVHWWAGCWRDANDTSVNVTHWRHYTQEDLQ